MLFGLKFVYLRLGMLRDAEAQFKSALKQQPMIATYLHLGRIVGFYDKTVIYCLLARSSQLFYRHF